MNTPYMDVYLKKIPLVVVEMLVERFNKRLKNSVSGMQSLQIAHPEQTFQGEEYEDTVNQILMLLNRMDIYVHGEGLA